MSEFPIDIVIRWAGLPTETKRTKCQALGLDPDNVFPLYTEDLKYCLLSIYTNMPWFQRLYLLLDDDEQVPPFLSAITDNRLTIVRHSQFIPNEFLPTYNSNVIDSWIHRVPCLAEHFIVFDDDTFVLRPVEPRAFFRLNSGKPITRHYEGRNRHKMKPSPIGFVTMWQDAIRKFGFKYSRIQHHAQPFRKSLMEQYVKDTFAVALNEAGKLRTRSRGDINLLRFTSALMSQRGDNVMIRTGNVYDLFIEGGDVTKEKVREIMNSETRPTFLCVNNTHPSQTQVNRLYKRLEREWRKCHETSS